MIDCFCCVLEVMVVFVVFWRSCERLTGEGKVDTFTGAVLRTHGL